MDYRQNPHLKIIQQCAAAVAAGLEPVRLQRFEAERGWVDIENEKCTGWPCIAFELYEPHEIRIKPRTVTVAGVELPEPLRVAPENGVILWTAGFGRDEVDNFAWGNYHVDKLCLNQGLLHSTREAAEQWREFLLSMTRSKE